MSPLDLNLHFLSHDERQTMNGTHKNTKVTMKLFIALFLLLGKCRLPRHHHHHALACVSTMYKSISNPLSSWNWIYMQHQVEWWSECEWKSANRCCYNQPEFFDILTFLFFCELTAVTVNPHNKCKQTMVTHDWCMLELPVRCLSIKN